MTEVFQIVICGQISSKSLPKWIPNSPNLFQNRVEKLFQNHDRSFPNSDLWPNLFQNEFPTLPISSKIVSKSFQNHDRSLPNSDFWPNLCEISSPNSSKIEPRISPKVRFLYFWSNSSITLPISSKIVSKKASKIMTEVFQIVICGQISSKSLPKWFPNSPNLFQNRVEKFFQNHDRSLPNSDLWPNLFQISSKMNSQLSQSRPKPCRKTLPKSWQKSSK